MSGNDKLQKEYNVLSDLKKEVEHVLREGRRQVEDKRADTKLNTELDAIKALYNKVCKKSVMLWNVPLPHFQIAVGDANCQHSGIFGKGIVSKLPNERSDAVNRVLAARERDTVRRRVPG